MGLTSGLLNVSGERENMAFLDSDLRCKAFFCLAMSSCIRYRIFFETGSCFVVQAALELMVTLLP